MIYPSAKESVIEIKNDMDAPSIDNLFQKKLKLKTMKEWSFQSFEEKVEGKKHFGYMVGKSLVGKSTIAGYLQKQLGYHVIDMKKEEQALRDSKGTEDAPFEGEIPISEVEAAIMKRVKEAKPNSRFIIDDYIHKSEDQFLAFVDRIGVPDFVLYLSAKEETIKQRYMKKHEAEELNEDQQAEIKADSEANKVKRQAI